MEGGTDLEDRGAAWVILTGSTPNGLAYNARDHCLDILDRGKQQSIPRVSSPEPCESEPYTRTRAAQGNRIDSTSPKTVSLPRVRARDRPTFRLDLVTKRQEE